MKTLRSTLEPYDTARLANLCGHLDQNLKSLEQQLGVEIRNRGNVFELCGEEAVVYQLNQQLQKLYEETRLRELDDEDIHLAITQIQNSTQPSAHNTGQKEIVLRTRKGSMLSPHQSQGTQVFPQTGPQSTPASAEL